MFICGVDLVLLKLTKVRFLPIKGFFLCEFSFWFHCVRPLSNLKGSGEPCVTRDVTTFITLMDAHGRAGHIEQMEIYHRAMLAAGHKPSLKVYNALLSAYGKAQDIEQMTYYVNKMEANGIPPNTGSYNEVW